MIRKKKVTPLDEKNRMGKRASRAVPYHNRVLLLKSGEDRKKAMAERDAEYISLKGKSREQTSSTMEIGQVWKFARGFAREGGNGGLKEADGEDLSRQFWRGPVGNGIPTASRMPFSKICDLRKESSVYKKTGQALPGTDRGIGGKRT